MCHIFREMPDHDIRLNIFINGKFLIEKILWEVMSAYDCSILCHTNVSFPKKKKRGREGEGSEKSKMNYLSIFSMLFSVLI